MHIFRERTCTHRTCITSPGLPALPQALRRQWQPRREPLPTRTPTSTCSIQSAAQGRCSRSRSRTHVVAAARCLPESIGSLEWCRLIPVLGRVFVAWPGALVCAVANSTLSSPHLSKGGRRSQDQQVSNGPRIDGRIYFAPASTSVAQTAYIGDNFFGRLSSSSSLILHERPSRPQVAGQAGQCGHSRVRRHHRFALHTSPASLPCLNPAFPRLR